MPASSLSPSHPNAFPVTAWSLVRLAMAEGQAGADQALDELCRRYERPILAYIQRRGHSPEAAADLKQAFFEHLLSKKTFAAADGERVKLRAFLITKLQSFLIDHFRYQHAVKRGADRIVALADLPLDGQPQEQADHVTPDIAFQRQWMETLAANAMRQLRGEYEARQMEALFDGIAPFITQSSDSSLAQLTRQLGRPEGTLKSDISRLRARCQKLIRAQIAETLEDPTPENVDAELRELMGYGR